MENVFGKRCKIYYVERDDVDTLAHGDKNHGHTKDNL